MACSVSPHDLIHWRRLPGKTVLRTGRPLQSSPGKTVVIPSYVCPQTDRAARQLHSREKEAVPPNEPLQTLVSWGKETLRPSPSNQRHPPASAFTHLAPGTLLNAGDTSPFVPYCPGLPLPHATPKPAGMKSSSPLGILPYNHTPSSLLRADLCYPPRHFPLMAFLLILGTPVPTELTQPVP